MKPKGLQIAVVLLAVLAGGIWWSNRQQAAKDKASPTDTNPKLVSVPEDQVREILIQRPGADPVDLRKENKKWMLAGPKPLPADLDAAAMLVSALASLSADKTIEDKPSDLVSYGLATPKLSIRIITNNGKTIDVAVGDDTPTNSGAYAKLAGDPHVYAITSFVKTSLDKKADDLRDKRLLSFDSDKLARVELAAKGAPVEFGKNGQNEWEIIKPRPLRADSGQVEMLISRLKDAKMESAAPVPSAVPGAKPAAGDDAAAKFATGTAVGVVTLTTGAGTQSLEVHKGSDNSYYAKSSVVEGIYKTSNEVGEAVNKGLDDFRSKKLFEFGFSDPSKVELKTVTYAKAGDNWWGAGKKMDNSTVQNLIDKLRDLTASKFVDAGPGDPVFEATVISNSNKRIEKVVIVKQGNDYFARREGEPSIYQLDAGAVGDIQMAAAGVKEAPAAAPAKK